MENYIRSLEVCFKNITKIQQHINHLNRNMGSTRNIQIPQTPDF